MANIQELRRVIRIQTEERGAKQATADLKQLDRAMGGVTIQAEKTTRATLSEERALRSLQTRLDPTFRATEKLAAAERTLAAAQVQGLISLARKNELMALASAQTDRAAASTGRLAGATRLLAGLGAGAGFAAVYGLARGIGEAVQKADELTELSAKVGVATEDLQSFGYAVRQNGVDFEQFTESLSFFNRQVGEAGRGGGDLLKILQANGVALRDQEGALRPTVDLFADYADLVANAGSAQNKATLVTKAFGRANDEMIVALAGGSEELRKLAQSAIDTGQVLDDELIDATKDLADEWDNFTSRLAVSFQTVVLGVITGVDSMIDAFNSLEQRQSLPGLIRDLDRIHAQMDENHDVIEKLQSIGDPFGAAGRPEAELARLRTEEVALLNRIGELQLENSNLAAQYQEKVAGIAAEWTKIPPAADRAGDALKDAVNIPLPRLRPEVIEITGALKSAADAAAGFGTTLIAGLQNGQGLAASLSDALGDVAGSLAGSTLGKVGAGIGSSIGGVAGSALGSVLGPLGTALGGLAGDALGGIIDGVFGDEEERPPRPRQADQEEDEADDGDQYRRAA